MSANCLQLNAAKTRGSSHHVVVVNYLRIFFVFGPVQVAPVDSAPDLGVYLDSDMTMKMHVTRLRCSRTTGLKQPYGCHSLLSIMTSA